MGLASRIRMCMASSDPYDVLPLRRFEPDSGSIQHSFYLITTVIRRHTLWVSGISP